MPFTLRSVLIQIPACVSFYAETQMSKAAEGRVVWDTSESALRLSVLKPPAAGREDFLWMDRKRRGFYRRDRREKMPSYINCGFCYTCDRASSTSAKATSEQLPNCLFPRRPRVAETAGELRPQRKRACCRGRARALVFCSVSAVKLLRS